MSELIYGKNSILEVLRAGRRSLRHFYHLQGAKTDEAFQELQGRLRVLGVKISEVSRAWFEGRFPGVQTQGWAAEVDPYPYEDFFSWLAQQGEFSGPAVLLALDQIQDPQNLGAVLRSAEACGVLGVLLPKDRACAVTPVVCRAAAGATEHLKVFQVTNLVRSLEALKKLGFWVVGTSVGPGENALEFSWPQKTVLVLGAEGTGMRRLVTETCDFLIHLPLSGKIASLNVSATAAACLFLAKKAMSL